MSPRLEVIHVGFYQTRYGRGTEVRYLLDGKPNLARWPSEMTPTQAAMWIADVWRPRP